MLRILLAVAIAMAIEAPRADACGNKVELTTNDYVKLVAKAEKLLERSQYTSALRTLRHRRMPTAVLQTRADDVRAVASLRTARVKAAFDVAATYFEARSKSKPDDVRFRAWLAEAYVGLGKTDAARAILAELHEKDLVPDGHAYLALAKLSTGTARYEFWKACRARVKDKRACELPAEVSTDSTKSARS